MGGHVWCRGGAVCRRRFRCGPLVKRLPDSVDWTHARLLEVGPRCPEHSLQLELVEKVLVVGVIVGHRAKYLLSSVQVSHPSSAARNVEFLILRTRKRMDAAIREDYRVGRVVRVAGWPLSLTEARIYALASLRAGN